MVKRDVRSKISSVVILKFVDVIGSHYLQVIYYNLTL